MADISLTASMRTNLLSLQNTQSLMDMTQERLSTGLKVNSAIDNAASYYTAQSLNNRANDLNALLDSMGQGIQTIQAANEGIEAITDFVEQAKAIANSARDVASKTDIKGLQAKFSDVGVPTTPKTATGTSLKFEVTRTDGTTLDKSLKDAVDKVNAELEAADLQAKSLDDYVAQVKKAIEAGGTEFAKIVDIKVDDKTGKITFTAKAGYNIKATGAGDLAGLGKDPDAGTPTNDVTSTVAVNTDRQKYALQFNEILTQIDNLAKDAGYKGINLLQMNTLTVIFNEDRSSQIEVKGTDASSVGLMLDEAVNNWQTNEDIETSIRQTEEAISSLRIMASDYGNYYSIVQNRQSFTKSLVNVLTEGADNLTLADMNEESANMLALQTRQQLAINSLSLASQAAQGVLQLF
ncbi:MAG: flagellar protein [Alphaproteobacteria bacterium]|nr:flagellar protein [Alphaproteobacteria bacterium]